MWFARDPEERVIDLLSMSSSLGLIERLGLLLQRVGSFTPQP